MPFFWDFCCEYDGLNINLLLEYPIIGIIKYPIPNIDLQSNHELLFHCHETGSF